MTRKRPRPEAEYEVSYSVSESSLLAQRRIANQMLRDGLGVGRLELVDPEIDERVTHARARRLPDFQVHIARAGGERFLQQLMEVRLRRVRILTCGRCRVRHDGARIQ